MRLTPPKAYKIIITESRWIFRGPFGYHLPNQQRIEIYPPKWAWFLQDWFVKLIQNHEIGHAWGIRGCRKPWCLMFEAKMWEDGHIDPWWEKPLALGFGLFNRWHFCEKHTQEVKRRIQNAS